MKDPDRRKIDALKQLFDQTNSLAVHGSPSGYKHEDEPAAQAAKQVSGQPMPLTGDVIQEGK